MRYVTIFFILFYATLIHAQITITADEYFAANYQNKSILTSFYQDSAQIAKGLNQLKAAIQVTGAGKIWGVESESYTTYPPDPTSINTLLPYPSGAPYADDADFLSATHVIKISNTNSSNPTYFSFFKFDQTGFWLLGASRLDSNGTKTKTFAYVPGLRLMKFPLTFDSSWQEVTKIFNAYQPGVTAYDTITNVVDSWGYMATPSTASIQCLRIKKIENKILTSPTGAVTHSTITSYNWLSKSGAGVGINIQAPSDIPYFSSYTSATPNSVQASNTNYFDLRLSSNPASNKTIISYSLEKESYVMLTLMDELGRASTILQTNHQEKGEHNFLLDASNLPAGMYIVNVQVDGVGASKHLIITK